MRQQVEREDGVEGRISEREGASITLHKLELGVTQARLGDWAALPSLVSPHGTALTGQALRMNGEPLPGATVMIGAHRAVTDQTGRFLIDGLPSGHQELMIDGSTANRPDHFLPARGATDWTRHSAIPAAPPKLPSIWKGGWASKRLL